MSTLKKLHRVRVGVVAVLVLATGLPLTSAYGAGDGHGGLVATWSFDPAGRLTNLSNVLGGSTISSYGLSLDPGGNPVSVAATTTDALTHAVATETDTYGYDDGGRLAQACYAQACSAWTYDAAGNRLTQQALGITTTSFYDGANHLCWSGPVPGTTCAPPAGDTAYAYNARGDMTAAGSTTYGYDLAERLTSAGADTYAYDGSGNRILSTHGGTTTALTWDPNAPLPLVATDSDSSTRDYVYAGGLVSEKVGSTRYYYARDAFGSTAELTSTAGVLKLSLAYDPWGTLRASSGTSPVNHMGFDSQYQDPTGAYNLRAREYLPALGAFQQADPASPSAYAFAGDRPTVMADPSGLFPWAKVLVGVLIGAIVAGAVACAVATVGICAGVGATVASTQAAAGGLAAACEEGGCQDLEGLWADITTLTSADPVVAAEGDAAGLGVADSAVSADSLNAIANGDRIGSGLKTDPFHSAPTWAEPGDIAANGQQFSITGADAVSRTLVQSPATVNGDTARFEWIIDPDGTISHQLFVRGGGINGVPIQP